MLLWPLQTHTSPKSTSVSASDMAPCTTVTVYVCAPPPPPATPSAAAVGGSTAAQREPGSSVAPTVATAPPSAASREEGAGQVRVRRVTDVGRLRPVHLRHVGAPALVRRVREHHDAEGRERRRGARRRAPGRAPCADERWEQARVTVAVEDVAGVEAEVVLALLCTSITRRRPGGGEGEAPVREGRAMGPVSRRHGRRQAEREQVRGHCIGVCTDRRRLHPPGTTASL